MVLQEGVKKCEIGFDFQHHDFHFIFFCVLLYLSVPLCLKQTDGWTDEFADIIVANNDCSVLTAVNINTAVEDLAQLSACNFELI